MAALLVERMGRPQKQYVALVLFESGARFNERGQQLLTSYLLTVDGIRHPYSIFMLSAERFWVYEPIRTGVFSENNIPTDLRRLLEGIALAGATEIVLVTDEPIETGDLRRGELPPVTVHCLKEPLSGKRACEGGGKRLARRTSGEYHDEIPVMAGG
ncbi:MAG: hypothetical protein HY378_01535 [Candidatus Brennerbacteria bacterium]|nr:hypothetical protein [Candidatus Brennerbacteria bacterium]